MDLPVNYDELHHSERRVVREQYVIIQKGRCYHCGELLADSPSLDVQGKWVDESLFPKGFFNHPVHLHHSHHDGMTIGAVHARCNAVLWQYYGE